MTHRQRLLAALRFEPYDRLPLLHFGFLARSLERWAAEGHLTAAEAKAALAGDGSAAEAVVAERLGFDFNYHTHVAPHTRLQPWFASKVVEQLPEGRRKVLTALGTIELHSERNESIPAVVDHLLKSRAEWDEHYLHRLQFTPERVTQAQVKTGGEPLRFDQGGLEYLQLDDRELPCLLHAGSLYGHLRDMIGVEGLAYLSVDDEPLLDEIIETNAELSYRCVEATLAAGARPDIGHFWEDICFKNGPLVNPRLFAAKVGPHYRRLTELMARHGLELVSLDSDGMIDDLIPTWLENGVNIMFPIEVGTWEASFAPWRARYGRAIRGVGGLDKRVFARDYAAVEAEIERLKPLIDLGGYIPCPDHRLPQDNRWENIQYFCERFRSELAERNAAQPSRGAGA